MTDTKSVANVTEISDSMVAKAPEAHTSTERAYDDDGNLLPTEDELKTLKRVAIPLPYTAYLLCIVEFAERGSYFGCRQVFANFVNNPLPVGGNGSGAPPKDTQQNAGALGKGSVVASAVISSFAFLGYGLPLFTGWAADAKFGRFKTICFGVVIMLIAHIVMIIAGIPSVLRAGHAEGPFYLSVYLLAIGSAIFKPNINPTILDQNPLRHAIIKTDKNGERIIADPEATNDSIMLWFYLLLNIGGFMGVPTAYLAKLVGFWAAFTLPGILYLFLPLVLWIANKNLKKQPPGGSDLGNIFKVLFIALKKNGPIGIFRRNGLNAATPSNLALAGDTRKVDWNDRFVEDVRRTFQACGIFLFFPIYVINSAGLGAAVNAQSNSMTTNGVPNDVVNNINSLSIICALPIMNHIIYPTLRRFRIRWGPISRITCGFMFAAIGSSGWAIIQHYIYRTSPCGNRASTCVDENGETLVSPLTVWWTAIPTAVSAMSEIFCNVTAYSVAYSRSPPNMKGLVLAINLFMTAIAAAISLATAGIIRDPYLTWAFAGPSIVGFVLAVVFYCLYRDLDKEEYVAHLWDDTVEGVEPSPGQTDMAAPQEALRAKTALNA